MTEQVIYEIASYEPVIFPGIFFVEYPQVAHLKQFFIGYYTKRPCCAYR